MINLDLNEIEAKTSKTLIYPSYYNWYSWKEVMDVTKNKEFYDVPLIDVPVEELHKEGKLQVLYRSSFTYYVCFGRFTMNYHRKKRSNVSRILFDVAPSLKVLGQHENNHCWMNEEQLSFWISTIREEAGLDFFYRIETRDDNRYHILFDFKRLNKTAIKYILFWTRYAFEYPASFCALDAMLLKRDYYPEETMQNLLTLTGVCQRNNLCYRINPDQCITVNGNFITQNALRQKLKTAKCIQNMFGYPDGVWGWQADKIYGATIKSFITKSGCNGKLWLGTTERFDSYTKIYKVLKEHEIQEKVKEEEGN